MKKILHAAAAGLFLSASTVAFAGNIDYSDAGFYRAYDCHTVSPKVKITDNTDNGNNNNGNQNNNNSNNNNSNNQGGNNGNNNTDTITTNDSNNSNTGTCCNPPSCGQTPPSSTTVPLPAPWQTAGAGLLAVVAVSAYRSRRAAAR